MLNWIHRIFMGVHHKVRQTCSDMASPTIASLSIRHADWHALNQPRLVNPGVILAYSQIAESFCIPSDNGKRKEIAIS
jgi:hypothetical protein